MKFLIDGLPNGDEVIDAATLAAAKRKADRMQVFPGGRIVIWDMCGEAVTVKEGGEWRPVAFRCEKCNNMGRCVD